MKDEYKSYMWLWTNWQRRGRTRKKTREWSDPLLHEPPPETFLSQKGSLEFILPCKEERERDMQLFGMNLLRPFLLREGFTRVHSPCWGSPRETVMFTFMVDVPYSDWGIFIEDCKIFHIRACLWAIAQVQIFKVVVVLWTLSYH